MSDPKGPFKPRRGPSGATDANCRAGGAGAGAGGGGAGGGGGGATDAGGGDGGGGGASDGSGTGLMCTSTAGIAWGATSRAVKCTGWSPPTAMVATPATTAKAAAA